MADSTNDGYDPDTSDYVPICEKCGAPATQNRTERKTLGGYGRTVQARVINYALCDAHALEYDVAHMAGAAMAGGPIPVPPSQAMQQGAIRQEPGDAFMPPVIGNPPQHFGFNCAGDVVAPLGVVGTPARTDAIELPGWSDRAAAAGLELPPAVLDDFQRLAEMAQGDAPLPQIDGLALDDQQSADAGDAWQDVIGIAYLVTQIDPDKLHELLAEYDRTEAVMPPRMFERIRANVEASRAITLALIELQATIAKYGGEAFKR